MFSPIKNATPKQKISFKKLFIKEYSDGILFIYLLGMKLLTYKIMRPKKRNFETIIVVKIIIDCINILTFRVSIGNDVDVFEAQHCNYYITRSLKLKSKQTKVL